MNGVNYNGYTLDYWLKGVTDMNLAIYKPIRITEAPVCVSQTLIEDGTTVIELEVEPQSAGI